MTGIVLKLNSAYLPIEIISWQDAICAWINGKAEIINYYKDKFLHSGFGNKYLEQKYNSYLDTWEQAMNMPAVIRLKSFSKPKGIFRVFKSFKRKNIYERDEGRCQYCGESVSYNKYQMEHVIPASRGGKLNWTNIVVSCPDCNSKKRNRTPEEAGMTLLKKPYRPICAHDYNENIYKKFKSMKRIMNIQEWQSWIYWNVPLDEDS